MSDFNIKQGDVLPVLSDTLTYSNGTAVNLTSASVKFVMRAITAIGPTVNTTATIVSATAGTVSYTFTATDTQTAGHYQGTWIVTFSGGQVQQFPTDGYLDIVVEENITTPGGQTLVSLGEAKEYLQINTVDRSRDARLLRFIEQLTPVIEHITGPVIQRLISETYDGGGPWIALRNHPILSVNNVTEFRANIPYILQQVTTPDQGTIYSYMFEPPGRIVRRTVGGGMTAFPSGSDSVFVTYTAGRSTVPANITQAACELVRVHFQQTQQGRPRPGTGGLDSEEPGREIMGFFVPNRVRELLEPNKRYPSIA